MDFKETKGIYHQIAERICDEILLGRYREDDRIPSVREYAATVEVNANTVMRSYEYLYSQGIIYNRRGIGYFVGSDATGIILALRKKTFKEEEADSLFRQMRMLGIGPDELAAMYNDYIEQQKEQ